ncbi:MAG: PmoA family protein [Fuerstiella sp.]
MMLSLRSLCVALFASMSLVSAADSVSFKELPENRLEILIGDQTLGILNHGSKWNKPFLFPLYAKNGKNVLRDIVPTKADQGSSKQGTDHFHHKGVWVSVDSVNDERLNFWHEDDRVVCDSVDHEVLENGAGQIVIKNRWLQGQQTLLSEVTTITIRPDRLLTYQIQLAAKLKDVTIHDTKEGFFAVRVAHTMRQMQGGHIENADGQSGEKQAWGKESVWVDYWGDVDEAICGVTLMDHPSNFRPSRYHVRAYGLFAISPFGPKKYSNGKQPEAPATILADGKPLTLTYGLYVHNGSTSDAGVVEKYKQFTAGAANAAK